jgi:error-prone DNA polymerase
VLKWPVRRLLPRIDSVPDGPALHGDEVPVTVAGVYELAQNPWMRSGKRTMFLTLEDAYGLYECVCFESKLAKIAPVVARAGYFLVRRRLQNNHKRGVAIVAEEVFDLEEVLARKRARRSQPTAAVTKPLPSMSEPIEMTVQQKVEGHGDRTTSAKKRAPGAGTGAIPKKVG